MKSILDNIKKNAGYASKITIVWSLIFFMVTNSLNMYNVMIYASYFLLFGILLDFKKEGVLVYIFMFTFFVFLVNRPLIDFFKNFEWYNRWQPGDVKLALTMIYISILSLYGGLKLMLNRKVFYLDNKTKNLLSRFNSSDNIKNGLLIATLILFIVSFGTKMYVEMDKFIFMRGRLYEEYYLYYVPSFNVIIKVFSGMYIYVFCFLVSFNLLKRYIFTILVLNILTTIPALMIGQRGDFVLALLISLVLYIMKAMSNTKQKWFSKFEFSLIVVAVPSLIILMLVINEGRHGSAFNFGGLGDSLIMFFHKQGVSFDTLVTGVEYQDKISYLAPNKIFMFGEIIDLLKYNPISLRLFGIEALPSGNNIVKALEGNSYAHILSFLSHHSYLKGFGFGTSYILEVFQTFGIMAVVLVNVVIGSLLVYMKKAFNHGLVRTYIVLILITTVFYLPRQPFSSLIIFAIRPWFWLVNIALFGCFLVLKNFDEKSKLDKNGLLVKINILLED